MDTERRSRLRQVSAFLFGSGVKILWKNRLASRDEHGQDWIRTKANFGWIRTGSDCTFFKNWWIRTGSDWENFCCFDVIILTTSNMLVVQWCDFADWLNGSAYFAISGKSSTAGVTNLFAIAGHFVSYRWVSRPLNFLIILRSLLKTKKIVHQQKQITNESNKKFKTAGLAWMLRGPHEILLRATCSPRAACSSPLLCWDDFTMHPTLSTVHIQRWVRNKMNVVKVLMSMSVVHVFSSSALTLCFGLAGKDHTFDGRDFYVLLKKIQV